MPAKTKPAVEPPEITYQLATFNDGNEHELIYLTFEQYADLKAHLETLKAPTSYQVRVDAANERAKVFTNLLGNLDGHDLQQLETVRLMGNRTSCGVDDPMSKFITSLIFMYGAREAAGLGLTIEDVEVDLKQLRENMAEAISEARFIASRYPQPELTAEARS